MVEVGSLAGLTVTGQAITTIEDEIRLAVPDAPIEVVYPALDWKRSEPSSVITRVERQIQRLPETLDATRAEAGQARGEAERAESRLGAPWDRVDELARLRRRQQEIDEQLAEGASKKGDSPSRPAARPGSPAVVSQDSAPASGAPVSASVPPGHEVPAGNPAGGRRGASPSPGSAAEPDPAEVPPNTSPSALATARLDAIQSRPARNGGISR